MMITEITKEETRNLTVNDLAVRMDAILDQNELERYGPKSLERRKDFPGTPSVIKILNSNHVQKMGEGKQRTVCYLSFSTMLQMQFSSVASAASNTIVYVPGFTDENWKSVKTQINSAALEQFEIISSRISMECFMRLLHFLGEGEKLKSSKSTFKSFKKWLNDPENPFSYFATHILRAFVFDRSFRTPEVHASSKLHGQVLRLQIPKTSEDLNNHLQLTNVMLNLWKPLLDILNDGKAYSMQGSQEDFDWLKSYLHDNDEDKASFLQSIFDQMQ